MSIVGEWKWKICKKFMLDSCRLNKLPKRTGNLNSCKELRAISNHVKAALSGTINSIEISYFKYVSSVNLGDKGC